MLFVSVRWQRPLLNTTPKRGNGALANEFESFMNGFDFDSWIVFNLFGIGVLLA